MQAETVQNNAQAGYNAHGKSRTPTPQDDLCHLTDVD
jgi:hypothetical protein